MSRLSPEFFLLITICFCVLPSSISFCHHEEAAALLHVKRSFLISSYPLKCIHLNYHNSIEDYAMVDEETSYPKTRSWNGTNCCRWKGVTCDNVTHHVTGLDLSCSMLEGNFPSNSTIFNLPYLESLNLASNNFLASKIPVGLGLLTALTHLDLSNSNFKGQVPFTISHLSKLEYLDLSSSYGQVDMMRDVFEALAHNMSQIRHIFLNNVNMLSVKLHILANFSSSLTSFGAPMCHLRGSLPDGLFNLPWLRYVKLSVNQELKGNLPNSIGQAKYLRYLNLKDCGFSGFIPNSYKNLSNIVYINLALNQFSPQPFPHFLTKLTKLQELYMFSTQLIGSIPNHEFVYPKLLVLDLRNNNLTGNIPLWIQNQPQIIFLFLSFNQLTGFIPDFITLKFEHLYLEGNKFQGSIPKFIYKQKALSSLILSSNNLSGLVDLDRLSKLQNLFFLSLGSTMLTFNSSTNIKFPSLKLLSITNVGMKEFPNFLKGCNNLESLDISNNKIRYIPNQSFDFSKDFLTALDISYNFIEVLDYIPWKNLQYLDVRFNLIHQMLPTLPPSLVAIFGSKNKFFGKIPSSICRLTSLRIVDLSQNKFDATIPHCLLNSSKLYLLNLHSNKLRGNIPSIFAKDSGLKYLDLNDNQLEGTIPESLSQCRGLELLNLGINHMNGTLPIWLETLPKLKVLILGSNNFHRSVRVSKHKHIFHELHILDLSNNNFSGHIPKGYMKNFNSIVSRQPVTSQQMYLRASRSCYNLTIKLTMKGLVMKLENILTTFTSIDLSQNQFSGEIPHDIGMLKALKGLNLSHNKLSGRIPQTLGNLKNLEWLDLSSNRLMGKIPVELTHLTFLTTLNLSSNQLTGSIPRGKQFNTFSNDSYMKNGGLCGFPLSTSCHRGPPPTDVLQQPTNVREHVIEWKVVLMGFPCGVSIGIIVASLVFRYGYPNWFLKLLQFLCIRRRETQ